MQGWIKLHRKITTWEWYDDANTFRIFVHLLLTANHQDAEWRGIKILRGQKVTSIEHLAKELKLSIQNCRTSLLKLKKSKNLTIRPTNQYSIITVMGYDDYQGVKSELTSDPTNDQQTTNKRLTTNKNDKNKKNENKYKAKIFLDYFNSQLKKKKYFYTLTEEIEAKYSEFIGDDPTTARHQVLITAIDNVAANSFWKTALKNNIDKFFSDVDRWLALEPDIEQVSNTSENYSKL